VFGISGGTDASKAKFCKKHGLSVSLLSDQDFTVARSYGVYGDKKFMGRSFKGIFRKTFVIDKAGKVVRVFDSVKPEGHAQEVLATLDDLRGGKKEAVKQSAAKRSSVKKVSSAKKGSSEKVTAKRVGVKKVASVKKAVAKKATPKRSTANSGVKRRR
jgi:alkyl hydroperoxide reductase subunit AhpC